jgi:hypothetical protein
MSCCKKHQKTLKPTAYLASAASFGPEASLCRTVERQRKTVDFKTVDGSTKVYTLHYFYFFLPKKKQKEKL